jgi:hypothetical protein
MVAGSNDFIALLVNRLVCHFDRTNALGFALDFRRVTKDGDTSHT